MSHINYSFNQTDDSLPRDKMKLRNIASQGIAGIGPPFHILTVMLSYFIL